MMSDHDNHDAWTSLSLARARHHGCFTVRCNRLLSAWHDIKAKFSGWIRHSRDVFMHGAQSVLQAPIVDSLEARLKG